MANDILYTTPKGYNIKWSKATNRFTCSCPDYQYRQSKTAHNICKHIHDAIQCGYIKAPVEMMKYKPRELFIPVASLVDDLLDHHSYCFCGSWRRGVVLIKDIDVIVFASIIEIFEEIKNKIVVIGEIKYGGDKRITAIIQNVQVDFRFYNDINLEGSMLLHFTGSKANNIYLRKVAISKGWKLSEYGLIDKDNKIIASKTEEEIYKALGLEFKTPKQR